MNPFPNDIEWTKTKCDFEALKDSDKDLQAEQYFANDVTFTDSALKKEKDKVWFAYQETTTKFVGRTLDLIENANRRVLAESENGSKSVCYIILTHSGVINLFSKLYELN